MRATVLFQFIFNTGTIISYRCFDSVIAMRRLVNSVTPLLGNQCDFPRFAECVQTVAIYTGKKEKTLIAPMLDSQLYLVACVVVAGASLCFYSDLEAQFECMWSVRFVLVVVA